MKKSFFTIVILQFFIMISCSHPEKQADLIPDKEKTVGVKVNINGISEISSVSQDSAALKNVIKQLTVITYRDGLEYSRQTQLNTDPSFGRMDFELPFDNIQFVAIGSNSSFGINQYFLGNSTNPILLPYNSAHFEFLQNTQLQGAKNYRTSDTFFDSEFNTVFEGNTTIDLKLERIVGKLEIDITDVQQYDVEIRNEATAFNFKEEKSFGVIGNMHQLLGNTGPVCLYILRTHSPLSIEITGGGNFKILQVPIFKNQRTVVRGRLLETKTPAALTVSVDTKWSGDSTEVIF